MTTTETVSPVSEPVVERRDALLGRLNEALTSTVELAAVYLGDRLGYYRALASGGSQTSVELASRTGTSERYVREWLEQQTLAGVLEVDDPAKDPVERRFHLPAGHDEVLAEADSLNYWAPQARLGVGPVRIIDAVLEAFRTGGGVPFAAYGADVTEGIADAGRMAYLKLISGEWLPTMPDVHARLQAEPPARVADIGVGAGWSSIGIAQGYPKVHVDGFDLDPVSVELAKRNVADASLADRVRIEVHDAGDPALAGRYDLVTAFGCLHDMSDPVAALRSMRRLAGDDGVVFVAAEARACDHFMGEGTNRDVERQFYGFSVLHCLPVAMVDQPSAATGTLMRPDTLRGYAREAGFREIEILPIEDDWSAFYRLVN